MLYVLVALDTILGLGVLLLVFLHSGKDAGLSTTFGGSGAFGGSGVVQKNLDRLTVAVRGRLFHRLDRSRLCRVRADYTRSRELHASAGEVVIVREGTVAWGV